MMIKSFGTCLLYENVNKFCECHRNLQNYLSKCINGCSVFNRKLSKSLDQEKD